MEEILITGSTGFIGNNLISELNSNYKIFGISKNKKEKSKNFISRSMDITKSGTRREELIFEKGDLQKMNVLRRIISPMGTMDAIEFINQKLRDTKNNAEFFNSMNKPA